MALVYESPAIEAFRKRVYARTITVTAAYTILGLVLAFVMVAILFNRREWPLGFFETLSVAVVGAGLGYAIGSEKAFALRLQAQMALFQANIEANTEQSSAFDAAPTRINSPQHALLVKAGLKIC